MKKKPTRWCPPPQLAKHVTMYPELGQHQIGGYTITLHRSPNEQDFYAIFRSDANPTQTILWQTATQTDLDQLVADVNSKFIREGHI